MQFKIKEMDNRGKFRIVEIDEIISTIEDHQVNIQTILGTRFVENIRE